MMFQPATKITKNYYEELFWGQNKLICGIDEVGRGSFFGPVVVGAVILAPNEQSNLIKDSKQLDQAGLNTAYNYLINRCVYAFGLASHQEIAQLNIYHATLLAMERAVYHLFSICQQLPAAIVVDAMPLVLHNRAYAALPIYSFPKGEDYSRSIASASILAKVYRDRLMSSYAQSFLGYGLAAHKGYGTPQHQAALVTHGPSFMHRKQYVCSAKQQTKLGVAYAQQTTIFCRDY